MRAKLSLVVFAIAMPVAVSAAQVTVTDVAGHSHALTGPHYRVTSDLGRRAGTNLLFDFVELSLYAGQSATFFGPSSTANVIGRVTGGAFSWIDGLIDTRTSMPSANLFLLNPSGIVFGPNASLNVGGSFHSSTADYLRFADGSRLLTLKNGSLLSVTEPVAFGFLGPETGAISINGGKFKVDSGKTLSFVGGSPKLLAGTLQSPGGLIRLIAARAGEIPVAPVTSSAKTDFMPLPFLQNGSSIDQMSSGPVVIRSGRLLLDGSSIASDLMRNTGKPYIGIDIDVTGQVTLTNQASITTSAISGPGRSGDIKLHAASVALSAGAAIQALNLSEDGRTGDILVRADELTLSGMASINSLGFFTVVTGDLTFDIAESALIGGASVFNTSGAGLAGNLTLTAKSAALTGGALIQVGSLAVRPEPIDTKTESLSISQARALASCDRSVHRLGLKL